MGGFAVVRLDEALLGGGCLCVAIPTQEEGVKIQRRRKRSEKKERGPQSSRGKCFRDGAKSPVLLEEDPRRFCPCR